MESKHSLLKSFKFALDGIKIAIKKGRNFRIQSIVGTISIILGLVLKITKPEWLTLILVISIVLILELINTAVEEIVNMISPEIRDEAKIAKDVSAGAVLLASIASIIIGVIIFLSKI